MPRWPVGNPTDPVSCLPGAVGRRLGFPGAAYSPGGPGIRYAVSPVSSGAHAAGVPALMGGSARCPRLARSPSTASVEAFAPGRATRKKRPRPPNRPGGWAAGTAFSGTAWGGEPAAGWRLAAPEHRCCPDKLGVSSRGHIAVGAGNGRRSQPRPYSPAARTVRYPAVTPRQPDKGKKPSGQGHAPACRWVFGLRQCFAPLESRGLAATCPFRRSATCVVQGAINGPWLARSIPGGRRPGPRISAPYARWPSPAVPQAPATRDTKARGHRGCG